jgi:hypothetical protein
MVARETRGTWRGQALWCAVATGALLVAGVVPAGAALTPKGCLAKKLKAWGNLRQCQATANGKRLKGKTFDLAKCQKKFDEKIAELSKKGAAAAIACRYEINGDGTVTDYDTGLQWEQKTNEGGVHYRKNTYTWNTTSGGTTPDGTAFTDFLGTLNNGGSAGLTAGVITISGCFADHCDWRLPSLVELQTIVDPSAPGCRRVGVACIDQTTFGPTPTLTLLGGVPYWAATTLNDLNDFPSGAWFVVFDQGGGSNVGNKHDAKYVRAVRTVL